jgi:hypothetical protein
MSHQSSREKGRDLFKHGEKRKDPFGGFAILRCEGDHQSKANKPAKTRTPRDESTPQRKGGQPARQPITKEKSTQRPRSNPRDMTRQTKRQSQATSEAKAKSKPEHKMGGQPREAKKTRPQPPSQRKFSLPNPTERLKRAKELN